MDRRVRVQVVDDFLTEEANNDESEIQIAVEYARTYHPNAVPDGTEEWKDCLEVLAESLALTIVDNVQDSDLSRIAAEKVADIVLDRVRSMSEGASLRSAPHAHIPGAMNVH